MGVGFEGPVVKWEGLEIKRKPVVQFSEGHYQGMVRSIAKRALEESGISKIQEYLGIKIVIHETYSTSPIGVVKSVMDAMTGVIYDDDIIIRALSVERNMSADSEVQVTLYSLRDSGEQDRPLLEFTVPGKPVPKGFPGGIWDKGFRPLHQVRKNLKIREDMSLYSTTPAGQRFPVIRKKDMMGKPLWVYLEVESREDFGDLDNLLRVYIMALQEDRVFGFNPDIRGIDAKVTAASVGRERVTGQIFARERGDIIGTKEFVFDVAIALSG